MLLLKALLRTNVLNDVTAAPFSVCFLQLAAVTSLRAFVRSNDFSVLCLSKCDSKNIYQYIASYSLITKITKRSALNK